MILDMAQKYIMEHYDEKGKLNVCNLSDKVKSGLKKVKKKVNDGTVVVRCSDKGNTLRVSDIECYIRQGREHTKGDMKIEHSEVIDIQRRLDHHSRALAVIFGVGANHAESNKRRCYEVLSLRSGIAPVMTYFKSLF